MPPDTQLYWYRLVTMIWPLAQGVTLFGIIAYAAGADHLSGWETAALALGLGVMTGTVGINYSHELMHQTPKHERWLSDILLAMVLYSHFRSEHLLVHHRYVGTPRDPVTARYNEGFHRFFPRVLRACFQSAWGAERGTTCPQGPPGMAQVQPVLALWDFASGLRAGGLGRWRVDGRRDVLGAGVCLPSFIWNWSTSRTLWVDPRTFGRWQI